MFRIAVIPATGGIAPAVSCLRRHTDLSVGELRARLTDGRPVVEFSFHDAIADIRRCRALLRDLQTIGAGVRVFEQVDGFGEREETLEYLKNVMRRNVGIAKQVRDEMEREAERGPNR